jgi:hypothetical protein
MAIRSAGVRLVILSTTLAFATAAGWWDGLDVELSGYDRPYDRTRTGFQEAADELAAS